MSMPMTLSTERLAGTALLVTARAEEVTVTAVEAEGSADSAAEEIVHFAVLF